MLFVVIKITPVINERKERREEEINEEKEHID